MGRNLLTGPSGSLESSGFKERGLRCRPCAGLCLQQHWEAWPGEAGVSKREPVLSPGQVSPRGL